MTNLPKIFAALGGPTRTKILELLATGPRKLNMIRNRLDLTGTAAHYELNILEAAGLIKRTAGHYQVNPETMAYLSTWFVQFRPKPRIKIRINIAPQISELKTLVVALDRIVIRNLKKQPRQNRQ